MFSARTCVAVAAMALFAGVATAAPGDLLSEKSDLKLCDPNVQQYAGYIEIDAATDKNYFYWMFESREAPADAPVILWMTGGPGCSSEIALFKENGPCHVNSDLTTTLNPYSWNSFANLLYIDQPAGTGFSFGDQSGYDHNEAQVSDDMYTFLQGFFKAHPQYQGNDFFITGESYGGHYVPATSYRVQMGNEKKEGLHINLKGVAVGNGLTDPEIQYEYYAQLAYNWSITVTGSPRISESTYGQMTSEIPSCISMIKGCQENTGDCALAQAVCNNEMMGPYEQNGWNPYDIRKKCGDNPLCYDFSDVTKYLDQASVREALGVGNHQWSVCNYAVNSGFSSDWMKNFQQDLPPQLAAGTPILIYAGDCDFVCNWLGNKAWTLNLDWAGHDAFNAAKDRDWSVDGKVAGVVRSANGFTFLQVHAAGHMVPMDQPAAALQMIKTLTTGANF